MSNAFPSSNLEDAESSFEKQVDFSDPEALEPQPLNQSENQNTSIHKEHHDRSDTNFNNNLHATQSKASSHIENMLDPSPPWDQIKLPHEILFVFLICLSQLLTQASVAQTIVPYKEIAASFSVTSPGVISWYSAGFSLTVGTFILVAGRLGDIYGLKFIFVLGFVWYSLWSLLCGIANYSHSTIFFSICRAFQGMGPALIMPNAVGMIGSYYPIGRRRVIVMCCFGSIAPSGFVVGSTFSSIFTIYTSWPWFFYVNSIACAIIALVSYYSVPHNIGRDFAGKKQTFDIYGAITGVSGLFLFNFAWNQGAVVSWSECYIYILLIVSILLLGLFIYIELKVAEDPLIPKSLYTAQTGIILGSIAAGWSSFGIWIYYTHQFGMAIEGRSLLNMSARLVPVVFGGIAAGVLTAFLIPRVHISFIVMISMCGFFCGLVLMGTRPVNQVYWGQLFVSTLVIPLGMDMSFPAASIVLSDMLPLEQQGVAGSIINTVVNYSISIGLGIAGTVELYQSKAGIPHLQIIRHCFYTGMGTAGLALLLSLYFVFRAVIFPKRRPQSPLRLREDSTKENMA